MSRLYDIMTRAGSLELPVATEATPAFLMVPIRKLDQIEEELLRQVGMERDGSADAIITLRASHQRLKNTMSIIKRDRERIRDERDDAKRQVRILKSDLERVLALSSSVGVGNYERTIEALSKQIERQRKNLKGAYKRIDQLNEAVSTHRPGTRLVFTPTSLRNAMQALGFPDRPFAHQALRNAIAELDGENN